MMNCKSTLPVIAIAALYSGTVPALAQEAEILADRRMKAMDKDQNGSVTLEEYTEFRRSWASKRDDAAKLIDPKAVKRAFQKIDQDSDNAISRQELIEDIKAKK